jgi:hypothetical protein
VTAAELPDLVTPADLAAFLKLSPRAFRERRNRQDWPFSPIAGFPKKGKAARWSKAHVLAVVEGQTVSRSRRLSAA